EVICLSFCRDTALEILALRKQGGGFLPCLTTKILRIYSSRFNWNINRLRSTGRSSGTAPLTRQHFSIPVCTGRAGFEPASNQFKICCCCLLHGGQRLTVHFSPAQDFRPHFRRGQ
ncbi:MAG: hypothetical protein IKI77_07475, partial [Oscillospiraceae bacterium]|nr:hypothetical protein [Oscillospiraceae bacterium]